MLALRQHWLGVRVHPDRPWDGAKACGCGSAGMPCPSCNLSSPEKPPRLPEGFQRDEKSRRRLSRYRAVTVASLPGLSIT